MSGPIPRALVASALAETMGEALDAHPDESEAETTDRAIGWARENLWAAYTREAVREAFADPSLRALASHLYPYIRGPR